MGTFNLKSSEISSNYEYIDTNVVVQGSFTKNAKTGELHSLNGFCYRNNDDKPGDSIGNFGGYPAGGEIMYDLSQMKRADSNIMWDAIDAIEPHVLGTAE